MSSTPTRPSPLSPFESAAGRQSPFKRQNSMSPATVRGTTPGLAPSNMSPTKSASLSPEKTSPFVRRPSQMNGASAGERAASPFTRPASSLSIASTSSHRDVHDDDTKGDALVTPQASPTRPSREAQGTRSTNATASPAALNPPRLNREDRVEAPPSPKPADQPFGQSNLRPAAARPTTTPSFNQPAFSPQLEPATTRTPINPTLPTNSHSGAGAGTYHHIPQALLHSMRESFEVLDTGDTGAVTASNVAEMLSQLGLDAGPSSLRGFFPTANGGSGTGQLNLARYLDTLASPLAGLSQPDELRAAFEAFDVDDSGQIDVAVLRDALLQTAPQPGESMERLSEREVDGILGEFAGRRAFGAKGMNAAKGKGEVFKYRDFMASVSGGGMGMAGTEVAGVV